MTVKELAASCELGILCLADGERTVDGAYVGDLLSWVMGRAARDNVWITIMSNVNVIAVASLSDVSCVILALASIVFTLILFRDRWLGIFKKKMK